jgi:hypothetical protein
MLVYEYQVFMLIWSSLTQKHGQRVQPKWYPRVLKEFFSFRAIK